MNTSSDTRGPRARGRVLRGAPAGERCAVVQYDDLGGVTSETLDPTRIEAAIEAGYRDGHAEGHAAGWADGHAAAQREAARITAFMTSALERLTAAVHAVADHEADILRAAEDAIAATAMQLAEAVIGRELELARIPGVDAIARSLAIAPAAAEVVIHLHPDDLHGIETAADLDTIDERVRLVADSTLSRGDAFAQWGDTILDARIDQALDRARGALLGGTAP